MRVRTIKAIFHRVPLLRRWQSVLIWLKRIITSCPERRFMAGAQSARPRASLKLFQEIPGGKNSSAISATTILGWTSSSSQDTIIYEFWNRHDGAVVAQP